MFHCIMFPAAIQEIPCEQQKAGFGRKGSKSEVVVLSGMIFSLFPPSFQQLLGSIFILAVFLRSNPVDSTGKMGCSRLFSERKQAV